MLTASQISKAITALRAPGNAKAESMLVDGNGLMLVLRRGSDRLGGRVTARWVLRYMSPATGKRRDLTIPGGFESAADLLAVRGQAQVARALLLGGIDPADHKTAMEAQKAKSTVRTTFADAARAWLVGRNTWTDKQRVHASNLLLGLGPNASKASQNQFKDWLAALRDMPVEEITVADVVKVMLPFWAGAPVAGNKALQLLLAVLDAAIPDFDRARWQREVVKSRPDSAGSKRVVRHHPALKLDQMPTLFAALESDGSIVARAVQFALLTGLRANEIAGAQWNELDMQAGLWSVPAARMKMRKDHALPLSATSLALLERLQPDHERRKGAVFPSPKGAAHVAPDSMREMLKRCSPMARDENGVLVPTNATMHGTGRAGFGGWVMRNQPQMKEIADMMLAHKPEATQAAYFRPDEADPMMRQLANDYAAFLTSGTAV